MVVKPRADGPHGQVAKYLRIESDILSAIKDGSVRPGDKLPGQSEMRARYGVSAITVRKAYADLINDGYLVGMKGSGAGEHHGHGAVILPGKLRAIELAGIDLQKDVEKVTLHD